MTLESMVRHLVSVLLFSSWQPHVYPWVSCGLRVYYLLIDAAVVDLMCFSSIITNVAIYSDDSNVVVAAALSLTRPRTLCSLVKECHS